MRSYPFPSSPSTRSRAAAALTLMGRAISMNGAWPDLATAANTRAYHAAELGGRDAAILDYVDLGADLVSIRGYDTLADAKDYGDHVLPLVRQELAHREEMRGEEADFRHLLDAVTLSHYQLDRALLEIQRYYESTGEDLG